MTTASEIAHEELEEFTSLGKVPWEERARLIRERYDSVTDLDWSGALRQDINLFGRMIRDVLKLEQAIPGRPGPRPSLDTNQATRRLQQLFGNDFTILPFPQALRVLAGRRSIRRIAEAVGLNKALVHRLLLGEIEPDGYVLRCCAEAFGKHPSYFLEWRILYITQAIVRRLEWSPETTIDLYRELDQQRKRTEA
jgi:transcriptional regulator with XRE-family HTH domain